MRWESNYNLRKFKESNEEELICAYLTEKPESEVPSVEYHQRCDEKARNFMLAAYTDFIDEDF